MAVTHEGLLSPYLRYRRIRAVLPFVSARVLDYGCGVGALAGHVQPDLYLGVDRDEAILEVARRRYPDHRFLKAHHPQDVDQDVFDTVVCLAVIEHVAAPAQLLSGLARLLTKKGRLVVTTPHPSYEALYEFGVRLGLFSHTALHEHQDLIGPDQMRRICAEAGLSVVRYRRFLFLANQLFVVRPKPTDVIGTVSGRPSGGALP